jgi:lipopolysaccharide export system permease protein
MRYFDTVSKSGGVFFIQRFEKNKLVYNMRAENFLYDTMKNVWKFNHVLERKMVGDTEFISLTPELSRKFKFKPVDLRKDEFLKDRLTTPQLDELIEIEEIRAKERVNALQVERYNRDAIPISVIVLSMIGAIIASKKVRGGSGFHMAIGILLSVLYVLFSKFSIVFSSKGNFPPLLAAWTPNLFFIMLAFYLYRRAPK